MQVRARGKRYQLLVRRTGKRGTMLTYANDKRIGKVKLPTGSMKRQVVPWILFDDADRFGTWWATDARELARTPPPLKR